MVPHDRNYIPDFFSSVTMKQKHIKIILIRVICIQKIKTGHEVLNQDPTNKLLLRHPSLHPLCAEHITI